MNNKDMSRGRIAVMLTVVIAFLIIFTMSYITLNKDSTNGYKLTIDINPSVGIEINEDGTVKDVHKLNDDAKRIFGHDDFDNKSLEQVLNTIIASSVDNGVLRDGQAILWSLDSNNNNNEFVENILNNIKVPLMNKNISANIYNQVYQRNSDLKKEANKYNISEGKMAFIRRVLSNDSTLVGSELARMTIGEIDEIVRSRNINLNNDSLQVLKYDNNTKNIIHNNKKVGISDIQNDVNRFINRYNELNRSMTTGDKKDLVQKLDSLKGDINVYKNSLNNNAASNNTIITLVGQLDDVIRYIESLTTSLTSNQSASSTVVPTPPVIEAPTPPVIEAPTPPINLPKPPVRPPQQENNNGVVNLGDINSTINDFTTRANHLKSVVNYQNYNSYMQQINALDREIDLYDDKLEIAFRSSQINPQTYYSANAKLDASEDILDYAEDACDHDNDYDDLWD